MIYEVFTAHAADRDILKAADYIEFVLHNPEAADALLDEVDAKIGSLSEFPERNAVVDDPVLKAWGIRFVQVKNYLAFYTVSQSEGRVYVVRFLYGKRDWVSILRSSLMENPGISAMAVFQEQMKGEANKAGFYSEDDVALWITQSRRKSTQE